MFRTTRIVLIGATVASVVVAGVTATAASAKLRPLYSDGTEPANAIETTGVAYNGKKVAIDSAFCMGLRRYGVQKGEYGLDKFWRFKCHLTGADGHFYTLDIGTYRNKVKLFKIERDF